jgi:N-acetylglucosamine kinase-like BadF-type ATPase
VAAVTASAGQAAGKLLVGVDGGNSKTEAILVDSLGEVVSTARTGSSSPHRLGVDGAVDVLGGLIDSLAASSGESREVAHATYLLAGVDTEHEQRELSAAIEARGWSGGVRVGNDTVAVLRAGGSHEWGVAVVCGAGINALAIAPDGRRAGYQALGEVSGDWGGGEDVGLAALHAAVRASDLRGPDTLLRTAVPEELGFGSPQAVADAVFSGALDRLALLGLPRIVFAASDRGDEVARAIVDRLADEVTGMAVALARRLDLVQIDLEVVLGGGILQAGNARLIDGIRDRVNASLPTAEVVVLSAPPVLGAVLESMSAVGADPGAVERLRRHLVADSALVPTQSSGE